MGTFSTSTTTPEPVRKWLDLAPPARSRLDEDKSQSLQSIMPGNTIAQTLSGMRPPSKLYHMPMAIAR